MRRAVDQGTLALVVLQEASLATRPLPTRLRHPDGYFTISAFGTTLQRPLSGNRTPKKAKVRSNFRPLRALRVALQVQIENTGFDLAQQLMSAICSLQAIIADKGQNNLAAAAPLDAWNRMGQRAVRHRLPRPRRFTTAPSDTHL